MSEKSGEYLNGSGGNGAVGLGMGERKYSDGVAMAEKGGDGHLDLRTESVSTRAPLTRIY